MDSIVKSWLGSEFHAGVLSDYPDACFALLGGSALGGYQSPSEGKTQDYDIDYWTLRSFDCDITSKYMYDDGPIHTHVDLYVHPLSCKFGETYMMGYFNTINWRNLKADSPIWVNPKYEGVWEYCLSVKDLVSKAGMSVMIERCGDWIKSVSDGSLPIGGWNKNVYRLCGLAEDLGLAPKDQAFLSRVKLQWKGLSDEDAKRARSEVGIVYYHMKENGIDWRAFKDEFAEGVDRAAKGASDVG